MLSDESIDKTGQIGQLVMQLRRVVEAEIAGTPIKDYRSLRLAAALSEYLRLAQVQ